MRHYLLSLLIWTLGLPSLAMGETLDEYVAQALEGNAGVQAAFDRWQASLAHVAYSASLPDPKLTYGQFVQSIETRVGPQRFKIGVAQMIPWLGKLSSRKDVASKNAVVAERQLEQAYVRLSLELRHALLDYYYLDRATSIQEDFVDLVRLIEQTAQTRVKVGGSAADVLQAQMELNDLENQLVTLQERQVTAAARVNALLNKPAGSAVNLPSDIEDLVDIPTESPAWRDTLDLVEANPMLRVIEARLEVQEARQELVSKNRYPDVTAGVEWVKTDRALMPTPDSGKDAVVAFVSVNVPIWLDRYRSQEDEAASQTQSTANQYTQAKFDVEVSQDRILASFSDARRRIELFKDLLIPQAQQALSILNDSYRTGRTDFERLQNAESKLLSLQLSLERSKADLGIALAEYQALLGGR